MTQIPEYVLDTSVVLKWFLFREEADRGLALQIQRAYVEGRILLRAPELLAIEVANVLVTGRRFTAAEVEGAVVALRKLDLLLQPLEWRTLTLAVELAARTSTAVYDCLFWAMAEVGNCLLVTADESFLQKVGSHPRIVRLSQVQFPD